MSTTNETNTEIGGIEYNKNYIYSQNDVDTRLIDVLGNLNKLEAAGAKGLIEGENFTIPRNGNINDPVHFQIIKVHENKFNGFCGAIIQNLDTKENILWCDGSKGFDNPHTFNNDYDKIVDWVINDVLGVGSNSIYPQLQELKDFAEEFGVENIDVGIGSSMAGISMSTLAFADGFENIKFRTYSGCTTDGLIQKIANHPDWGINLKDGANLESYYTPNEPLIKWIKPHIGNNKFYIKDGINIEPNKPEDINPHSAVAYNNYDGNKSIYYPIDSFNTDDFPLWKLSPRFDKTPSMTGTGMCLKIIFPIGKVNNVKEMVKSTDEISP